MVKTCVADARKMVGRGGTKNRTSVASSTSRSRKVIAGQLEAILDSIFVIERERMTCAAVYKALRTTPLLPCVTQRQAAKRSASFDHLCYPAEYQPQNANLLLSHFYRYNLQDARRRPISFAKDRRTVRFAAGPIYISSTGEFESCTVGKHFQRMLIENITACCCG